MVAYVFLHVCTICGRVLHTVGRLHQRVSKKEVFERMGHRDLVLININGVLIIGGYVLWEM